MSALGSIVLHLDASPRSVRRLKLACELAAQHEARVTALYATNPAMLTVPFAMDPGGATVMSALEQIDTERRDRAKAMFDRAIADSTAAIHWRELSEGPLILGFATAALYADLLVLGQHDASDPHTGDIPPDFVPSVLMTSGRPGLVVPYADTVSTFGEQVLIAWKPTRESARAVSAALPLLRRARQIHLSAADDAGTSAAHADALEAYLRLHGVHAPVQRHGSVPADDPGDGLLSLAADVAADLLVMGCYSHSRARELVLGGASRTVLKSMTLPVLMSH